MIRLKIKIKKNWNHFVNKSFVIANTTSRHELKKKTRPRDHTPRVSKKQFCKLAPKTQIGRLRFEPKTQICVQKIVFQNANLQDKKCQKRKFAR